jgi:hypothetical protein
MSGALAVCSRLSSCCCCEAGTQPLPSPRAPMFAWGAFVVCAAEARHSSGPLGCCQATVLGRLQMLLLMRAPLWPVAML